MWRLMQRNSDTGSSGSMASVEDSPYWTPLRRELLAWFNERVPGFADGYVAAVDLVHRAEFPARVHLVCHLVRDIYRDLPRALGDTSKKNSGVEVYPSLLATLRDLWETNPLQEEGLGQDADRLIGAQVYAAVEDLVRRSRELKKQASVGTRLARALFRAVDRPDDTPIPGWIFKAFDDEYGFFVQRAHLRESKAPSEDGLLDHFEAFERAFHSMVGSYFRGKEELDAILADTNRRAD
jgi:hypothetical protein